MREQHGHTLPRPAADNDHFGIRSGAQKAVVREWVPRLRTVTDGLDGHAGKPGLPRLLAAPCKQVIMATRWAVILLTLVPTTAPDVLGFQGSACLHQWWSSAAAAEGRVEGSSQCLVLFGSRPRCANAACETVTGGRWFVRVWHSGSPAVPAVGRGSFPWKLHIGYSPPPRVGIQIGEDKGLAVAGGRPLAAGRRPPTTLHGRR